MLSKKSSLLLSQYATLNPLSYTHAATPTPCQKSCRHRSSPPSVARQTRTYAQHVDPPGAPHDLDLLQWPEAVKPHQTPTPYQILKCRKGETYTKQRFYALVKLYHPDRGHTISPIAHLPAQVRLDRYRMLVTANDILSDIEKRKAYDSWGHGWAGHHRPPATAANYEWEFDKRRWASDPRNNATWEDWERWRHNEEHHGHGDARTIQLSNFAFMSLIFAFVSIGGVLQGTRFNAFHGGVLERRDQIHREASTTLLRSKNMTMSGDRDERIRTFLDHREAQLAGEASYQRLLPPAESCGPEGVRKQ